MKKIIVVLLAAFLVLPVLLIAEEPAAAADEFQWPQVVLLGADVLLIGLSAAAVIQQNSLATDYATLVKNEGSSYDMAQYWRMKYEKEKVDDAGELAGIACAAAAASLAYTALDYFWLHGVFKGDLKIKTTYDPANRAYGMTMEKRF